jgi:hypothetical protein
MGQVAGALEMNGEPIDRILGRIREMKRCEADLHSFATDLQEAKNKSEHAERCVKACEGLGQWPENRVFEIKSKATYFSYICRALGHNEILPEKHLRERIATLLGSEQRHAALVKALRKYFAEFRFHFNTKDYPCLDKDLAIEDYHHWIEQFVNDAERILDAHPAPERPAEPAVPVKPLNDLARNWRKQARYGEPVVTNTTKIQCAEELEAEIREARKRGKCDD